jgi:hypothetical protein
MIQETTQARGDGDGASYRAGVEKAMSVVWKEKNKHSVISETYFTLKKVWEELSLEAARHETVQK